MVDGHRKTAYNICIVVMAADGTQVPSDSKKSALVPTGRYNFSNRINQRLLYL